MKKVILTFDDGPSEKFAELLNYLIKNKHKAIFFIIGKNVNRNNEKLLIKAIKKGFLVGNHSYSHPHFSLISLDKAKQEILKTEEIIEKLYKKAKKRRVLKIFRFPFFDSSTLKKNKLQKFLKEHGFKNPYYKNYSFIAKRYKGKYDLFCTLDPKDWSNKTTKEKAILRIKKAENGDIIDLHDHAHAFNNLTEPICEYLTSRRFKLRY